MFISLEEQYAEILVDRAIEDKIGRDYFLEQIRLMLETCSYGKIGQAFEETIQTIAKELSVVFPQRDSDENELSDKLIVI